MIFLLHGFNVSDGGTGSIDKLKPYLRGEVCEYDYGWKGLLGVRMANKGLAEKLARMVSPGDVGIGHSNGCAILHLASHMGAKFRKLVYINPALDSDAAPGPHVESLDVWHSPSDAPVRLARWLPWHAWGDMGAKGYTGPDERVKNFDKQSAFSLSSSGHSDVFDDLKIRYFGPLICGRV